MENKYNEAIIVCNADQKLVYCKNSFYVGVEQGALAIIKNSINLNLAIADFDSVTVDELDLIKKKAQNFIQTKTNKNFIDGEIAIMHVISKNIKKITLYLPEINPRIDMFFISMYFACKYNVIIYIGDNLILPLKINFKTIIDYNKYKQYKYLSIIPITKSKIKINNMKYNINKFSTINPFTSHTISNELVENTDGMIFLKKGRCILVFIK